MQAITSPRNGYCIPRVSYIAVTTGCDSTDGVDASASQHDVAVGDPPEGRAQMMAGRRRRARPVFLLGAVLVMTIGGLAGWLGYQAVNARREAALRTMFVQMARQGALDLTTIDYTHADNDVHRILDGATGKFRADFQSRSQPLVDVVKQARSKSQGTITEAGLESFHQDSAQALLAVAVTTTYAGNQSDSKAWRMRIDMQKVGNSAKISNVEFVP
jgi:Mce-associated membrane protein